MVAAAEDRRWRLQAWDRKNVAIHDGTCVGDQALNDAIAGLERRPDFKRFSVTPDATTARQTVTAEVAAPPPAPDPLTPCRECNRREPDCRAIPEAVSGHVFNAESSTPQGETP